MRLFCIWCVLIAAGLLAGCGDKAASPQAATATAAAPTAAASPSADPVLTAPDDVAACAQLVQTVRAVSVVVGHTTEEITKALHPKELAVKMGTAQHSLLDSAKVIEIVPVPKPLAGSQRDLAKGLRMFAADFGRAKASAAKGDMATAAQQTVDEDALRKVQTSAKRIDDRCGA
jgi:hypothetical protein